MKKFFIVLGISAMMIACSEGGDAKEGKGADTPATSGPNDPAPATTTTAANERGLELIGASDCTTCHGINDKKIGPAYVEVAKKYENTPENVDMLVGKIINGGKGNWGEVAMTAHPDLPKEDAKEMVNYILSLKNQ